MRKPFHEMAGASVVLDMDSRYMNDVFTSEAPEHLSKRLNLPFKDFFLLSRALTHRSYLNENKDAIEDNERLEFLGDAVLDFIVADWLYNHYPESPKVT